MKFSIFSVVSGVSGDSGELTWPHFNYGIMHNIVFHESLISRLANFCMFLLVLKGFSMIVFFGKNIKTFNLSSINIMLSMGYIFHIWLYLLGLNEMEILNRTLDPNLILVKGFVWL